MKYIKTFEQLSEEEIKPDTIEVSDNNNESEIDDSPTGYCESPTCRKAIYDGSSYCDGCE